MIADLKPYLSMKDSGVPWLGEVPEHWRALPGKSCYREKKVPNIGLKETTVLSLSHGQIVVKPVDKLHGLVPASFETYQIVDAGNIIVRPTDLQNDWNSLRFGLSQHRGIITSAYMCLLTTDTMMQDYGHLLLHAYDLKKVFYGLGSGLRQNLDWSDFKYLPCVVPPLPEQAAIVRFLYHTNRRIEKAIQAKRKLITLLNEQKQIIINRAVTRGLGQNVSRKQSDVPWLGYIPNHWEAVPLKGVCTIQSGITLGKFYIGEYLSEFPYLRVANVQAGRIDLTKVKTLRLPLHEAKRSILKVGDVLMTEGGDPDKLGRGCVWKGEINPCLHQNHVFAVRPNIDRLRPHFLAALLESFYGKLYFLQTAKQTTNLASTNKTTIGQFRVLLPYVEEQDAILRNLEDELNPVSTLVARTEREITLLREYRTRLIADVVTGKLDVRDAAKQLPEEAGETEAPIDGDETEFEPALTEEVL